MPIDYAKYGPDWRSFSAEIRFQRARGQCECSGQCGLHGGHTQGRRCVCRHRERSPFTHARVVLTTAHLCACDPPCTNPNHVIAACQRCHLRIDAQLHATHRRENQQKKRATLTQDVLASERS
jgi:hypothetical protein